MYPRVKVRVQKEEDDQYAYQSLPSLKAFESLSISDFSSSGRTKDNNQSIFGGSKTKERATSVPRPRAVLSSPDNDQMISTRSKTKAEVLSGLKNHNSCQNRHHVKCKTFPKSVQDSHHTSVNKGTKVTDDGKLDPRLVKADPSRRTPSK